MIFGVLKIEEKITHSQAFPRPELRRKRMNNKIPNGNIIVDRDRMYNRFDGGVHKHKFDKIKRHYVIGSETESRMLTPEEIRRRAPKFLSTLGRIVGVQGNRGIDIISRKGSVLTARQVKSLLMWLDNT
jgi:hypothetical protein